MDSKVVFDILDTCWQIFDSQAVLIEKCGLAFDCQVAAELIYDKKPEFAERYDDLGGEFSLFLQDFASAVERKEEVGVVFLQDAICDDRKSAKEALLSCARDIFEPKGVGAGGSEQNTPTHHHNTREFLCSRT